MAYEQLATDILVNVGGPENIRSIVHCTTRLRFKLKDEKKAHTDILKNMDGVVTVVQSGGQYQVVIGNQVADVYDSLLKVGNIAGEGIVPDDDEQQPKMSLLDQFIDLISGIFAPTLGVLAATGMIKGLVALFVAVGWLTTQSGTYQILFALGDTFFYFFPIMLGYSASKKFRVNPFLGMVIGASLVYPTIVGLVPATLAQTGAKPLYTLFAGTLFESPIYTTFLGIPVIMMSYASSVIPIVVAIWFTSKVEPFFKKILPEVIRTFLVPFCTALVVVPVTFLVIGPLSTWLGNLLGAGSNALYQFSPVITGAVLGGLWQVLVIFGLHWGLIPLALLNISTLGYDTILTLVFAASFAQIGAVLAITLRTKDKKLKGLGWSSFISGIFGVTEPAIYGITLPRKKPFIFSCIGGAIGGLLIGAFGTRGYLVGGLGVFGIPNFINPKTGLDMTVYGALIAVTIAFIVALFLTFFFGNSKADQISPVETSVPNAPTPPPAKVTPEIITSPLNGTVHPLSDLKDPVFSSAVMGQGVAITPIDGQLFAPVAGTVSLVFPTGHAIGINSEHGAELLMHVGMDTVQLEGKPFTVHVKQGQPVLPGDLLLTFDIEAIQAAGYEIATPVIITNSNLYNTVEPLITTGRVTTNDKLLKLK
ncbi:beta-glucoside-specific PTS transporter subunit IIABC [Latilactobacillus graminis]|uniref:PTS system sucrose-specific EIIBCA component n=2 Tax=Latilactobacillus graminis TaxID=60519 RepID=A0AA89L0R2_9LACO|nr:beta-glucoside-specific PTS transporter subunit IIABC [Latilactobacillus graminis]KRM23649.1 beta-glucosides PTS, EIIBCA [Latilactobacillus graminis DSM 20719]QFP80161.1 PTS beta-glucoside transporter subunit IIABC [Latilactobacillus graminis]